MSSQIVSSQIAPSETMPSETEARSNRSDDALALEEDARLRTDIRLLGRILGDTVRDQEGADVFDLVERIRQTSIRFHRDEDKLARRELEAILDSMSTSRHRADRPRLQLFLASRQHRRGPEQHPPDARPRRRRAAAERAHPDPGPRKDGRLQRRRPAPLLRGRPGQPGADRASDRSPPQEHDGPRDGDRGAARPARTHAAHAGRGRSQRRATAPRRADAVADQSAAPDQADRARRGRQRPVVLRLHLPARGAAAALRAGGPPEPGGGAERPANWRRS